MTQLAEIPRSVSHTQRGDALSQSWLDKLRAAGTARFQQVGYPTPKHEDWRFVRLDGIVNTRYAQAAPSHDSNAIEAATAFSFGADALTELVFINGHYTPQLSRLGKLPRGATVQSFADAIAHDAADLQDNLGRFATIESNPFVALNTGSLRDGAFINLPRGTALEAPIHLLFVSTSSEQPISTQPRVLVVAGENVEACVVESYVGEGAGKYFTNAVTEFVIGADSRIDHCKLQQESLAAHHIASMAVHLGKNARFVSHSAALGGHLTRNEVSVTMAGEYADATINGLVVLDGDRVCDNHTLLDHAVPNCPSHELYKHVLAGNSRAVFKGKILVRQDAQKTDSKQTSKTLLLSDDARMNSMPALEIYADDVKCTHGSTTGPVDEEQVFYLRSRGVDHEAARHLLTYAFAADVTRRIKVAPVRARIENFMAAQHGLPLDLRITDLGDHDEAGRNS
jgi:Fe-S cluster assembly protein SufD